MSDGETKEPAAGVGDDNESRLHPTDENHSLFLIVYRGKAHNFYRKCGLSRKASCNQEAFQAVWQNRGRL